MIVAELLEKQTTIEWLSVSDIGIDMAYQRLPALGKIKAISAHFDQNAVGVLIVSLRDNGQFIIIDGQHRLEAMKKQGITHAECKVIQGLTREQEAEIYISCNTVRKNPDALDVFRARLVTQDPVALAINSVVEKCGLRIQFNLHHSRGGKRAPKSLWAVTALEDIYKRGKEPLLEDV